MKKKIIFFLSFLVFPSLVYAQLTLNPITTPQLTSQGNMMVIPISGVGGIAPYIFSDDSPYFDVTTTNPTTGTGEISFTPDGSVGSFIAVIIVLDAGLNVDAQAVEFMVNRNPVITTPSSSSVDIEVLDNVDFSYTVEATDLDVDILSFSSSNPLIPINSVTGDIFISQASLSGLLPGPAITTITVSDGKLGSGYPVDGIAQANINLYVNDPLILNPIPDDIVNEDSSHITVINDYITNNIGTFGVSSVTITDIATLETFDFWSYNAATGELILSPEHIHLLDVSGNEINKVFQVGVVVKEDPPYSQSVSQSFNLNVNRLNDVPVCDPIDDVFVKAGDNFYLNYSDNVTDEEGIVTFTDDTSLFDIDLNTGVINFIANESDAGSYVISIISTDTGSLSCTRSFNFEVSGNNAPIFPSNKIINLNPASDLYTDSDFPDSNFPGLKFLNASGNPIRRSYLMFDLKQTYLPYFNYVPFMPPATLISAVLNLTVFGPTNAFMVSAHDVFTSDFNSLSYNDPGIINSLESSVLSGIIDSFDVINVVKDWLNYSRLEGILVANLSNEGVSGNIGYYSVEADDFSKWPVLTLEYKLNISDYNWTSGKTLNDVFVLDNFFFDPDGDALTYSVIGNLNTVVDIDSFSQVSFGNVEGFVGEEIVTFVASDGLETVESNSVKLIVLAPPFVIQEEQPQPETRTNTRNKERRRVASIGIVFDTQRKTVGKGAKIEVPVKIKNTGEVILSGIELETKTDSNDLKVKLSAGSIGSLAIGADEEIKMTIDTGRTDRPRHTISLNAKATNIEESGVFILDVIQENTETFKQIELAKRLFLDNPECLEFQEIVERAEDLIENDQIEQAQSNVESAIEGCKSLIRIEEKPGSVRKNYEPLIVTSLIIMVTTLFLVVLYLIYKRVSYRFKEE